MTNMSQFAALMATASQTQSETATKLARLKAAQDQESRRIKERELAAKEREKQETWGKAQENHGKHIESEALSKAHKPADKSKALHSIDVPLQKEASSKQQRSMTFKKLLKEAAKIDSSTFKLGPKVKVQPKTPVEPKQQSENGGSPVVTAVKSDIKLAIPARPAPVKSKSPVPFKASIERRMSSSTRNVSRLSSKQPAKKPASSSLLKSCPPTKSTPIRTTGKDTKSRLLESFVPNELIPLAQGPRRDRRTIEEIQNDLWTKKGKNYPCVTGIPKGHTNKPSSPTKVEHKKTTDQRKHVETSKTVRIAKKRQRNRDEESEDSFIAYSDEEEASDRFDYRTEIRAMFSRKGPARVIESDDDSDMEATGFEMAAEEVQATRLARLEDEAEERREEERRIAKKKRKMEAENRKVSK